MLFEEYEAVYSKTAASISNHHDVAQWRQEYVALYKVFSNEVNDLVETRDLLFESDGLPVEGRLFSPKACAGSAGCLIYIHGGGFVAGELSVVDGMASDIAAALGVRVVTFHYRLAPETHFPGALVDTVSVVEQVFARHKELGVDTSRIILSGESCGGNLAVAAPIMLRAKNGPLLCGIAPINPVLDVHRWARKAVQDVSDYFAGELYQYTSGYLGPHFTWFDDAGASPLRSQAIGLCRKVFKRLSEGVRWTQLSSEGCELLERRHTIPTELALADHVRGFDPSQCCGGRLERLEAQHWPSNLLDKTVVLLNDIVEIFGLNDVDDPTSSREFEDYV